MRKGKRYLNGSQSAGKRLWIGRLLVKSKSSNWQAVENPPQVLVLPFRAITNLCHFQKIAPFLSREVYLVSFLTLLWGLRALPDKQYVSTFTSEP